VLVTHGVRALLVAGATAVASDHSIAAAVIVAAGGLLTLVVGQITAEIIRRTRRPPCDHHAELASEQSEMFNHLFAELVEERAAHLDADNARKAAENEVRRLKRGRRG
jgi:hypothetical protein